MRDVLARHVEAGELPGLVALVARKGAVHVEAIGRFGFSDDRPMRRDTIFRVASFTKPVVAVGAMILVEECRLRLDDPIDAFVPELADRRVLTRLDGPLDDTVPAVRPITLRDLLTMRMGIGHIMADARAFPVQQAIDALPILKGPPRPQMPPAPDAWIAGVATLPLMHQPGEGWMYDLSFDVLGVLIARAAGMPLDDFLAERIFEPLGMKDTAFCLPPEKLGRLPDSYARDFATGEVELYDAAAASDWNRPPAFPSASGGLVSTVDDMLAFGTMMLDNGSGVRGRILSRPSVELMTANQITEAQRLSAGLFLGDNAGWGFGVAVTLARDDISAVPGRYGWDGGLGTSWRNDPTEDMVGILMTQRAFDSPRPPAVLRDFWTLAYQAIND